MTKIVLIILSTYYPILGGPYSSMEECEAVAKQIPLDKQILADGFMRTCITVPMQSAIIIGGTNGR